MKRFRIPQIPVCLLFSLLLFHSQVNAQMGRGGGGNQVSVTGWTDDTHYILRTFDSDKKPVPFHMPGHKMGKGIPAYGRGERIKCMFLFEVRLSVYT